MDVPRFPAIAGKALDGTPFAAPRDLAVGRTVVMVGFALEHKAELESWVPFIDKLVRSPSNVHARLLIALGTPKLLRRPILTAMKAAVSAPEQRASTIPLFVNVEAFARSLGISDRAHLTLLLVEPDGRITWRGSGPFSDVAGASLSAALR